MEGKQNIYYALGILAYAVAKADGKVQNSERKTIHDIVIQESEHSIDFTYAEIIFSILQKDNVGIDTVYKWAMDSLKKGKTFFTPEVKEKCVRILQKIAEAFPPSTKEEQNLIERFSRDIYASEMKIT